MLDVVVYFEVAPWLEAHQSHAHSVKFLDLQHFVRRDLNFLIANWVVSADLLLVEHCASVSTDEPLS